MKRNFEHFVDTLVKCYTDFDLIDEKDYDFILRSGGRKVRSEKFPDRTIKGERKLESWMFSDVVIELKHRYRKENHEFLVKRLNKLHSAKLENVEREKEESQRLLNKLRAD